MIVVYEPFSTKLNHVPVNVEFLSIIAEKFNNKKIVFYGEKQHLEKVKEKVNYDNIDYRPVTIVEPVEGQIKAVLNERKNVKKLTSLKEDPIELLVILNSHPHTMLFVKRYTPKQIPIIFIVHGNIEEIKRKKRIYQLGYWIRPAFRYKRSRKNVKYIVLGESIRKHFLEYIDYIREDLVSVPHPYTFTKANHENTKTDNRITLGMIGSFSPEKRSTLIFDLEERIRERNIGNIGFLIVGSGDSNVSERKTSIPFVGDGIHKLSDEEYNRGIAQLDYILFFWPRDSYQLTASGALCDAIVHEKPIISIRNDYLDWVFSETGSLGFLCDDLEEMEEIIVSIANGERQGETEQFKNNFEKAREFFSREHVAKIMEDKGVWMI